MTRMVVESRVDEDGVLKLSVPVGKGEANRTMRVTIEPLEGATAERLSWPDWLDQVAGSWQGEFEEPEDLPFEERDSLP